MSRSADSREVARRIRERQGDEMEQLVYEKSGGDVNVRKSEVVRAAAREYIKKHSENLRVCDPESRGGLGGGSCERAATKCEESEYDELRRVAYELSEPGNEITVAEVLRAALRDYIDKHKDGVRDVEPSENGGIESPFR